MSKATKAIRKALPTVFTMLSGVATVAAVVFAAKEGPKYQKALEEKEMTTKEKIVTAAKTFAPAAGCAAVSIACTVGAHCMDLHTQASLTGAYVALQETYKKYRAKNTELNGEEADDRVLVAMEEEKLPEELRNEEGEKIYDVCLSHLCEDIEMIPFRSTKAELLMNIIRVNKMLDMIGAMTVNDLLEIFGLPKIAGGDEVGWSQDMISNWAASLLLDFDIVQNEDKSLTIYPMYTAYGGYLTDYGMDY